MGLVLDSSYSIQAHNDIIDFKATGAVNIEESAFIPYLILKDVSTMRPI
jgi:hypothetical protein